MQKINKALLEHYFQIKLNLQAIIKEANVFGPSQYIKNQREKLFGFED